MNRIAWFALAATLGTALVIAAVPDFTLRYIAALCLLLLPGFGLVRWLPGRDHGLSRLEFAVLGLALGYVAAVASTLVIHYLPGTPTLAVALAVYAVVAAVPWVASARRPGTAPLRGDGRWATVALAAAVLLASVLFFVRLDYSEFQGDEAMVMLDAGSALSGDDTVLFFHRKGPAEIALPMALWLLGGSTNELAARVPFALAGILAVAALFLVGRRLFNERVGLAAAALFALNGLVVGFSRIVQYQSVVMMTTATALLCFYIYFRDDRPRFQILGAALLATGFLAHYDAIFAVPVIAYLYCHQFVVAPERLDRRTLIAAAVVGLGVLALFYWPFLGPSYYEHTSDYLVYRSGSGISHNNLPLWMHISATYSSFAYVVFMLACLVGWTIRRVSLRGAVGISAALLAAAMALAQIVPADDRIAFVPFALAAVFLLLVRRERPEANAIFIWFVVPFLIYSFLVKRPGTHFWTMSAGLSLIAGDALDRLTGWIRSRSGDGWALRLGLCLLAMVIVAWFGWYVAVVFLQPNFLAGYPETRPLLHPSPYNRLPDRDFFGFPHRVGWRAIAALYERGELNGEFDSNEGAEITSWYVPAPRHVCRPEPEYYFIATNVLDTDEIPRDDLERSFDEVGSVMVAGQPGIWVYQRRQPDRAEALPAPRVMSDVDRQTTRKPHNYLTSMAAYMQQSLSTTFGEGIELLGYDLNSNRACPDGRVVVTLYWRRTAEIVDSHKVFVHLESDRLWAAGDDLPGCGLWPTNRWREGEVIVDRHVVELPTDLPPGDYPITVGLYHPETGERLNAAVDGQPVGTSFKLRDLTVSAKCQ